MKKYIILMLTCMLVSSQLCAQDKHFYFEFDAKDFQEKMADAQKYIKEFNIDMDSLQKSLKVHKFNFDNKYMHFDPDSVRIYAWNDLDNEAKEKIIEEFKKKANKSWKNAKPNKSDKYIFKINPSDVSVYRDKPVRTEKKTYSNISEIKFDHSYGNIEVRDSNSNQVELEIHYYESESGKTPTADITVHNKTLTVNTVYEKNLNNNKRRIDYIVSIPKGVTLSVDLKYGNISMGVFDGKFKANLEYSNLRAKALGDPKPDIKCKYGNIHIGKVEEFSMSGDYTNVNMDKATLIDISGRYNNYKVKEVDRISGTGTVSYGSINLDKLSDISVSDMRYVTLNIGNLQSNMNLDCSYSTINIGTWSPKVDIISIKGNYSDIELNLPKDANASFDTSLTYGKINISDKHKVVYTRSQDSNNQVIKVGRIGSGSPTTKITITNRYADIKLK